MMKIGKTVSQKKLDANRRNAQKSTGAKSDPGRRRASRNARKFGLFSPEIVLSGTDEQAFDDLRSQLRKELQPSTKLQELVFEYVLICAWKYKQLLRWEQAEFRARFEPTNDIDHLSTPSTAPIYAYGGRDLRACLKLLYQLAQDAQGGYVRTDLERMITDVLGSRFWELISNWRPTSATYSLMVETMAGKTEDYNFSIPGIDPADPNITSKLEDAKNKQDVLEGPLRRQFLLKWGIHLTQVTTIGSVPIHGTGGGGLSPDSG